MFRKLIVIVACSAFIPLLTATAHAKNAHAKKVHAKKVHAKNVRQDQRLAGASLNLDGFNSDFVLQHKGAPGKASSRALVMFGEPESPSDRCEGFAFETPVVGGTVVITFADLSNLIGVFESGFFCNDLAVVTGQADGIYVGGTRRFEGASGTFSVEAGGPFSPTLPGQTSVSGSITGTINLDN